MLLPRSLARFNRAVTNRVQGLWADRLPPWAVVEHRGRTSGRRYETPVLAWRRDDRLAIHLYYGADTDWVRNVLAAGEATVLRAGSRLTLTEPRVVDTETLDLGPVARLAARPAPSTLVGSCHDPGAP